MRKLKSALFNSFHGFLLTWKHEWAFRVEVVVSILLLPLVFLAPADKGDKIFVLISFVLVLITELLNTAIEKANDVHQKKQDSLIKFSKDAASGAVFIALCLAGISLLNLVIS